MGPEAGQSLSAIINRKDAERIMGSGVFYWGIGTALGQKFWKFIDTESNPKVLFSPMKSKPKITDVSPEKVYSWNTCIDRYGHKSVIPAHVLVTSRSLPQGVSRGKHYALVCRKSVALDANTCPMVDWSELRNYASDSKVGYSQVTAVVEKGPRTTQKQMLYEVTFSAELVAPYYVTLADPLELSLQSRISLTEHWNYPDINISKWKKWLRTEKAKACSIIA
jgi:hypothetical protein